MRRSRFAGAVKVIDRDQPVAWLDTLSFDLRAQTTSDDSAIAEQRIAQLNHVPLLLGVAHLISSAAILLHYGLDGPFEVDPDQARELARLPGSRPKPRRARA